MVAAILFTLSIAIQLAAAALALRLIRITGRTLAWVLLSAAILLMVGRRIVTFISMLTDDKALSFDLSEYIALVISGLMLAGVYFIGDFFRSIQVADESRERAEADKRASDEKLITVNKQLRALLQGLPDSLTLLSPDLKIIWTNCIAGPEQRSTPEETFGRFCYDVRRGADKPCGLCPVLRSMSTGEPASETVVSPGGRIMELRTVPISENGRVTSVVEVARDITAHRQLEQQYLQAQKMESIGTLASGVAHDFNNIISIIVGHGGMVLKKMAADDPLRIDIESILEAGNRAAHLTRDLLLFSRKQKSQRIETDIVELVRETEKLLKRIIGEDIECRTVLQAQPLVVHANAIQLEQALLNLAANARDAMPQGGVLFLDVKTTQLTGEYVRAHPYGKPGTYAQITVSDTGMGMSEETRKRIFEPFFTTKEVGKGTGLGLAVVYGIVKQHDGYINVSSRPGEGTTFMIYLPISGRAAELRATPARPEPARGRETILLAEDDEALRRVSSKMLEAHGYRIVEAANGEDAVATFRRHQDEIRLLLLDVVMPRMSGRAAYEEILKSNPGIKAIFMSGYDPVASSMAEPQYASARFIPKPIHPEHLLREIRSLLDGHTGQEPAR